jgi:hypothetical protein
MNDENFICNSRYFFVFLYCQIKTIEEMKQEDKDLLLKDLCSRIPYKPIVQIDDCGIWSLRGADHDDSAELRDRVIVWHGEKYPSSKNSFPIINCKPYLIPLSSMTEEDHATYSKIWVDTGKTAYLEGCHHLICTIKAYKAANDYLLSKHYDTDGLIPKGLAIDATKLNIY